jgi:hypothetical protein
MLFPCQKSVRQRCQNFWWHWWQGVHKVPRNTDIFNILLFGATYNKSRISCQYQAYRCPTLKYSTVKWTTCISLEGLCRMESDINSFSMIPTWKTCNRTARIKIIHKLYIYKYSPSRWLQRLNTGGSKKTPSDRKHFFQSYNVILRSDERVPLSQQALRVIRTGISCLLLTPMAHKLRCSALQRYLTTRCRGLKTWKSLQIDSECLQYLTT